MDCLFTARLPNHLSRKGAFACFSRGDRSGGPLSLEARFPDAISPVALNQMYARHPYPMPRTSLASPPTDVGLANVVWHFSLDIGPTRKQPVKAKTVPGPCPWNPSRRDASRRHLPKSVGPESCLPWMERTVGLLLRCVGVKHEKDHDGFTLGRDRCRAG